MVHVSNLAYIDPTVEVSGDVKLIGPTRLLGYVNVSGLCVLHACTVCEYVRLHGGKKLYVGENSLIKGTVWIRAEKEEISIPRNSVISADNMILESQEEVDALLSTRIRS